MSTEELVARYIEENPTIDRAIIEDIIPMAINVLYRERDEDHSMDEAAAAVAITAVKLTTHVMES